LPISGWVRCRRIAKLHLYGNDRLLLNDHTKAIIDILRGTYR
jgi:hypothetical protein